MPEQSDEKPSTEDSHAAAAASAGGRRVLFFKIFALSLPVLFVLLLEAFFAFRFHSEYPNSSLAVQGMYRFVDAPYREYANNPSYLRHRDGIAYRYNNCGFREEEDLGAKGPNEFRVFFMGGSAAYGGAAREKGLYRRISGQKTYPSSETIASHMEESLQRRMPDRDVNVINAAVSSYRIRHDFLAYLGLIRLLSPDLIVAMDGYNEDLATANPYAGATDVADLSGGPIVTFLRSHSYLMYYGGLAVYDFNIARRSAVEFDEETFAAMDIDDVRRDFAERVAASEPNPEILDELMKVYESFWHTAQLDGVPILFTIQPVPILDHTKPLAPEEENLFKYEHWRGAHEVETVQIAHLADRLEERAVTDLDFHFMSLLSIFEDYPELAYSDYVHLTPGANRHLAERLAGRIASVPDWMSRPIVQETRPAETAHLRLGENCGRR